MFTIFYGFDVCFFSTSSLHLIHELKAKGKNAYQYQGQQNAYEEVF